MRKLSLLFMSLIILFTFFSGFYLYYVPSNKQSLNKYAFLILQNMAAGLTHKITGGLDKYTNNLKTSFEDGSIRRHSLGSMRSKPGLQEADIVWTVPAGSNCPEKSSIQASGKGNANVQGELYDVSNEYLTYLLHKDGDSIGLSVPLAKTLGDFLQVHPNDFYQSFLLLKICGNTAIPLFKSEGLNLGAGIELDSLLTGSKGAFYPGTTNVHTGNQDYTMFYIPINIKGWHFVLCGFKNTEDYQDALHKIPPGFIYPITILLLLLLIILPLIKLYIMGPGEKVKIWDFIGFCFSLFAGSMFITIIIIQVILLKDGDTRMKGYLTTLSKQIDSNFRQELGQAYRQLEALDTLPEKALSVKSPADWHSARIDISPALRKYLDTTLNKENVYYNFDRISWVDSTGMQVMKGAFDEKEAIFTDVSKRKYFKDLAGNNSYRLPGSEAAVFTMEPVYNWVNGAFRIIIAKPSKFPHAYITTLSTIMYSVNQTVLPPGFGFCIIDPSGNVQVHSNSTHDLNENFLDELDNAGQLQAAIVARQELYINETQFYGRQNGLLVTPIKGIPFYLVTFYDKGYILPVNMRILIFSLLFCFALFLICLVIWLILFWRRYYSRPLLFTPLDYLYWIIPRKKYAAVYFGGFLFLSVYVAVLLLITFLTNFYAPENNHIILVLLLLTPLIITGGLMIIGRTRKAGWHPVKEENYLVWYTILIEALVVCLSVIPASLFTWYSHNQEIVQDAKKDQLFLARSLDNRRNNIYHQLTFIYPASPGENLFDTLQYARGIFSIHKDKITRLPGPFQPVKPGSEKFYFEIQDYFSNDYYDPQYFPVLQAHSADLQWQWSRPDTNYLEFIYNMSPDNRLVKGQPPASVLNIRSEIPPRYIYLADTFKSFILVLGIFLLLLGLYKLIRRISEGIFLQKFVRLYEGGRKTEVALPMIDAWCLQEGKEGTDKENLVRDMKAAVFNYTPVHYENLMDGEEYQTIMNVQNCEKYYAFVLAQCSPRKKYLLYNFSLNGFLNYKNVTEIYQLIEEGILIVKNGEIRLFSTAFRAYILQNAPKESPEPGGKPFEKTSAWESFKIPFMVLLFTAAAFIFFTQQEAWQRISALITGVSTSLPLLINLFKTAGRTSSAA